jgi:dTDP-4-amino-4,6-dideoxygalactose transaminase
MYARYKQGFDALALETLASGQYVDEGAATKAESGLARACQRAYAVTVGSCTDALYFALLALGIGPGDKVAVPAVSFIASVTPILRAGAVPVFVDIEPENGLISLPHLESILQQYQIKAVIGVDLYGNLPDSFEIERLIATYHFFYIEDAAQSLGSKRNGVNAGSMGIISCLSFDPTKVIHAFGSGGAIVTDDPAIADKIRRLRYHGKSGKAHVEHGFNSRMNTLQLQGVNFQLQRIEEIINDRRETAEKYVKVLNAINGIDVIIVPECTANFHKFVVLAERRDHFQHYLEHHRIKTMIHYPFPLYKHEMFVGSDCCHEGVTHAETLCSKVLTLPLHTFMHEQEVEFICEVLHKYKP